MLLDPILARASLAMLCGPRGIGKTYLALVEGHWPANKKVLDAPLARYLLPSRPGSSEPGERRGHVR